MFHGCHVKTLVRRRIEAKAPFGIVSVSLARTQELDPRSAGISPGTSATSAHSSGTVSLGLSPAEAELTRAEDDQTQENTLLPESFEATAMGSSGAQTSELTRLDALIDELKQRHRLEIRTVLVALFAFVAFASFFLCFFWARFNLQSAQSAPQDSAITPPPVASLKAPLAPQASATVSVSGLASGATTSPASPAPKAASESSAAAPGVARKLPSFKIRQAARNYGI